MFLLHCACFTCLYATKPAVKEVHCVSNTNQPVVISHKHSLFVNRAAHYAQAACIAEQTCSTVSASMLPLHVSWWTDSHTVLLRQLAATSVPACHHCMSGHQAGAALPSALSVFSRFAISMAVTAASPPLLPVLPPARSRA